MDGGVFISQNKEGLWNECEDISPVGWKDGDVIFPWCQQQSALRSPATAVTSLWETTNKR